MPRARYLLAISMCILLAALLVGVAAPAPAQAVGTISGTVRNADGALVPVPTQVSAWREIAGVWTVDSWTTTAAGVYTLTTIGPDGLYAIGFNVSLASTAPNYRNLLPAYLMQWWNNQPTPDLSAKINVTPGSATTGINATLGSVVVDPLEFPIPAINPTFAQGEQVTIEWSTARAVAGGEFGVYVRRLGVDYPVAPQVVPAVGADFSIDFTLPSNVPVGTNYEAHVAYRSSSTSTWNLVGPPDDWVAVGPSRFDVTAGFTTTVAAVTGSYNAGDVITVNWTTSRTVAFTPTNQFGIWARSGSGVYSPLLSPCRYTTPFGTSTFSQDLTLAEALPGSGYQIVVGYSEAGGAPYTFWGTSPGSFTVGSPSITVTAPTGGTFSNTVNVSWTTNAPVAGQFGIWVRSGSGVWSPLPGETLDVVTPASSFTATVALDEADPGSGFQAIVAYRPGVAPFIGPWVAWGTGAAFNVSGADFITVTNPAAGASFAQAATITVRWTLSESVPTAGAVFNVWVRDKTGTTWYGRPAATSSVAGVLNYQVNFPLVNTGLWTVPVDTGYQAIVNYSVGPDWGTSGAFSVTSRR